MPKNKVSDPITDQEIAFARLVLSGAMTDRQAAEAVGLSPDSAAYTKAKPRVHAYMFEHRAAVQQQLAQQEAEGLHRLSFDREQVLARLWQIANLSPEMTRNSVTGQVKALSMIVAMLELIPGGRAVSSEKKTAPAPAHPQIYPAAWRGGQQVTTPATTNDPQPAPAPAQEQDQQEDARGVPEPNLDPNLDPNLAPGPMADPPPDPDLSQSTIASSFPPSESSEPYVPPFSSAPDTRVPFSIKKTPFARRR